MNVSVVIGLTLGRYVETVLASKVSKYKAEKQYNLRVI